MRGTFFASTHLPYCFIRTKGRGWVVVNRHYKPIGFLTGAHIDYDMYPISDKWGKLTKKIIQKIALPETLEEDRFYLYDDSCAPMSSKDAWEKYCEKLFILGKLRVMYD